VTFRRDVDVAVDELRDSDGPVTAGVQEVEVAPEMSCAPAPPAVLLAPDEVVLEDGNASAFVDGTRVLCLCA